VSKDDYPNGGGNEPGGAAPAAEPRVRRRGGLPTADQPPAAAPLATQVTTVQADGDLAMTAKQKLPEARVWGVRVSEGHYETARTMTNVLATRYNLDQRQVGELLVQFLVANRFALDEYVANQVGPAIDLDFFTKSE
jgi:hypothetical protein